MTTANQDLVERLRRRAARWRGSNLGGASTYVAELDEAAAALKQPGTTALPAIRARLVELREADVAAAADCQKTHRSGCSGAIHHRARAGALSDAIEELDRFTPGTYEHGVQKLVDALLPRYLNSGLQANDAQRLREDVAPFLNAGERALVLRVATAIAS